ncbi:hypothetical protein AB6A40_001144 [Gnathostoma spinigerum]|uniref:Activator of basal transcription 1 n=1 Tax=Gnathostoma spinigerum TaxID=75299 RepID=A0ABD6E3J4_9BILA
MLAFAVVFSFPKSICESCSFQLFMSSSEENDEEKAGVSGNNDNGTDEELMNDVSKEKEANSPSTSEGKKKYRKLKILKEAEDAVAKEKRTGIIYFQSIPPFFTVSRMRAELSKYGEVGRIYLQAEKHRKENGKHSKRRFTEGWVEMMDKSIAKRVVQSLNRTAVGGKRRSFARETLWTMKYLPRFKWAHLTDQLEYERRVERQRLRNEISQAKREASFFSDQIEKGENLKRLEKEVLKKGGVWKQYQRQLKQKKAVKGRKSKGKAPDAEVDDKLLNMIFTE